MALTVIIQSECINLNNLNLSLTVELCRPLSPGKRLRGFYEQKYQHTSVSMLQKF